MTDAEEKDFHEVSLWIEESVNVKVPFLDAKTQEEAEELVDSLMTETEPLDKVYEKFKTQSVFRSVELIKEDETEDAPQEFIEHLKQLELKGLENKED